jgi:hypothetical protein
VSVQYNMIVHAKQVICKSFGIKISVTNDKLAHGNVPDLKRKLKILRILCVEYS